MLSTGNAVARRVIRAFARARCKWDSGTAAFAVAALMLALPADVHATDATYRYDALGRLIEVASGDGKTSQYKYDAAGNLLSVVKVALGTVAITDFYPRQGPVGTTVVIQGSGFCAAPVGGGTGPCTKPADNTVTFAGTAAAVQSGTATQLTVTVPAGATNGKIKVSNGSSTATSADAFTVSGNSEPPTLTSFTPDTGAAGDAVTINGTNFDKLPANDKVTFGATGAVVTSATLKALQTTVPRGAGSGPIGLQTPDGTAASTADFYAVPAGYSAASVAAKGRLVVDGGPKTFAIASASRIGLVLFSATKDQYLTLTAPTVSFASMKLAVFDAHGQIFVPATVVAAGGGIQLPRIPLSGTYTIVMDPAGGVGQAALALASPAVQAPMKTDGTDSTVTIPATMQRVLLTFQGDAGALLTLQAMPSLASMSGTMSMIAPGGVVIASGSLVSQGTRLMPKALPFDGTYSVVVDTAPGAPGSLRLWIEPEDARPLGWVHSAYNGTIAALSKGKVGRYAFSGVAGNHEILFVQHHDPQTYNDPVTVNVYRPTDPTNPWVTTTHVPGTAGIAISLPALPDTSTDASPYVVTVVPSVRTAFSTLEIGYLKGEDNSFAQLGSIDSASYPGDWSTGAGELTVGENGFAAGATPVLSFFDRDSHPIAPPVPVHLYDPTGVDLGACVPVAGATCGWSAALKLDGRYTFVMFGAGDQATVFYGWLASGVVNAPLNVWPATADGATPIDVGDHNPACGGSSCIGYVGNYQFQVSAQADPAYNTGISISGKDVVNPPGDGVHVEHNAFIDGPQGPALVPCYGDGINVRFGCYVPPTVFSVSGTYALRIIGGYRETLTAVAASDVTTSILAPDDSQPYTTISFPFSGQRSRQHFFADSQNKPVTVSLAGPYAGSVVVNIYNSSDPTTVIATGSGSGTFASHFTLQDTGSYILELIPSVTPVTFKAQLYVPCNC